MLMQDGVGGACPGALQDVHRAEVPGNTRQPPPFKETECLRPAPCLESISGHFLFLND